jgi:hypothetical protein
MSDYLWDKRGEPIRRSSGSNGPCGSSRRPRRRRRSICGSGRRRAAAVHGALLDRRERWRSPSAARVQLLERRSAPHGR